MCILAISVRGMAKKFVCRLMGFGFSEMAKYAVKIEAKNLSTGSQRFSGSQHKLQSQNTLTKQHSEWMELQKTKALAKQSTKTQSQGSQSEAPVKILSESGGLSKSAKRRKQREWEEAMRILESHSYKPNSEGRKNKHRSKKQSQGSENESQVKMGSESRGFSEISNCRKQLGWNKVVRMLKANSEGYLTLSNEQMTVLKAVSRGESVFLTGSAGTGKSYLLDFVVKILKKLHGPRSVFVTASTGIAACHLNATTLHSFAGAPPRAVTQEQLLTMIENKDKTVKRWRKAKALVIDEISMIDGELFDQLNYVANKLRQPLKGKGVWGGLQLVAAGDFFQLPPVRPDNPDKFFAFEADSWNECFHKQIELTHVFRQSDRELVEMLQEIRRGMWDSKTLAKLKNCHGPSVTRDESVIRLYPMNDDVRRVNDERLKALGQEIITFSAEDKGKKYHKSTLESGIAPDWIALCVGARVMLIKNIDTRIGLVNGATGQIVEFVRDDTHSKAICPTELWPKVRFLCGVERIITPETWRVYEGEVEVASRRQVPLILAWAVTVHKCQGMTLERLETDLSRAFDYGMVYVALSRVKNLDGLRLTGFKPSNIKAHPKVLDFYQKLTKALAKQSTKNQSQGSQSEAPVKIFSESGGLSNSVKRRKKREWAETMRVLESHSDKPNSEGRKNKNRTRKQSQGSQNESQVKMGSESGGVSEISNCRKQVGWNKVMRMLKANSEGYLILSNEQMTVLKAVSRGESVFLTGSAGTGKSYLLDFVVKILKKLHGPGSVFVTASTGIAACHLNGMTLHSFAGAPPYAVTQKKLLTMIEKKDKNVNRWKKAKALVIDEISMIDGELFDQLNYVANKLRQPLKGKGVWGGLQLVVTGDFFQLPPVRPQNPDKFFAFQADCWNQCFDKQIELTHVFRQSDREFVEMLQEIRRGLCDSKILAKLNCHGLSVTRDESVTTLYPRNDNVRRVNDDRLKTLGQEIITFSAKDKGEEYHKRKLKTGIAPDQIGLCVGAQVMLIKNIDTGIGLVNGATGQIVDFVKVDAYSKAISPTELWPKVRFLCGVERIITPETWSVYEGEIEVASRGQVPLILAWAVALYKCQGMTLERLETNLSTAFDYGMVYVALSRVKNLDGLRLTGFKPSKIKAHPKVFDFYQKLTSSTGGYLDDKEKE